MKTKKDESTELERSLYSSRKGTTKEILEADEDEDLLDRMNQKLLGC